MRIWQEIKHDGFRVIARKDGHRVRLYSRPGNDLTHRFSLIVETLARLRSRSCIIDGEAVAYDDNGMPSFDHIRYRRHDDSAFLYAFDLIELNGDDLRREPLDTRKATLASILRRAAPGLRLNDHIEADGPTVFAPRLQDGTGGHRVEAEDVHLPQGPLAPLAQEQEPGLRSGAARRRGRLGKGLPPMSVAPETGRNRIMIYGPKPDDTYVVEFETADGDSLAINVPAGETRVLKHFQARMPFGLFLTDAET